MTHDYKLKVMYGGVFKPVKTKLGRKYVNGMQTSYTVLSDIYTLKEFFEDIKKMWDWGETEYVQLVYKSKNIKGEAQRFIDIKGESDFLSMLEQFTYGTEIEIYITISSCGIPFDFNIQHDNTGDEGVAEGEDDTRIEGLAEKEDAIGDDSAAEKEDSLGDESAAEKEDSFGDEGAAEKDDSFGHEDASEGIAAGGAHIVDDVGDDNVGYDEANEEVDESDGSDFVDFERSLVYSTSEDDSNVDVDEWVYDLENPIMDYGVKYPDVTSFRSSLNQFAIQNQFEYKVIKSDRFRVTARCRTKGCGWRIYATQIRGEGTFQVKTFQPEHTCEVVNRCGNKNATQGWIANRISQWLKTEAKEEKKIVDRNDKSKMSTLRQVHRQDHNLQAKEEEKVVNRNDKGKMIADCSEGKSFKPQHLEHNSSNMRQFPIHNRVQLFPTLTRADC